MPGTADEAPSIDLLVAKVDEVLERGDRAAGSVRGARALVDEADRTAVDARHHEADARRTLAGRLALRLLLASAAAATLDELPTLRIDRTCGRCGAQHGRPTASGASLSGSGSGGLVAVAVGPLGTSVGVDVEVVPGELWRGFDAFALHPRERDGRPGAPLDAGDRVAVWTEKEAVLKAAGVGLGLAPSRLLLGGLGEARRWRAARAGARWRALDRASDARATGLWSTPVVADGVGVRAALAASAPLPVRRRSLDELLPLKAEADGGGLFVGRCTRVVSADPSAVPDR